jgi:TRAP-type C4-dicarboxylate transport system permease small subunit
LTSTGEAGESEPASPARGVDVAFERIDRWSAGLSHQLFRLGIYIMLPALVVLVTLDVVLRYVFDAPLQWARDVSGLFLLMSICSVLPHAWDRAYHIRMEVAYDRFPEKRRWQVDVLSAVSGIVFFGMIAVQAARYVPFMIRTGETGEDLLWPLWPYMAFMSVSAAVTVARIFANPSARRSPDANAAGATPGPSAAATPPGGIEP